MANYNLEKMCYLCLSTEDNLNNILLTDDEGIPYTDKIEFLMSSNLLILQTPNTYTLCDKCSKNINSFFIFKRNCMESNRRLEYFINEKNKEKPTAEKQITPLDVIRKEIQEIIDMESKKETNCEEKIYKDSLNNTGDNKSDECVEIVNAEEDNPEKKDYENVKITVDHYKCSTCFKIFKRKKNLEKHLESHEEMHKMKRYVCETCKTVYNEKDEYMKHLAYHWVEFSCDQMIPKNAVVCGVNAEDKTKIYIGRAFYQGDLCIVSYFSGLGKGYLPYHGGIVEIYAFQLLINYLPQYPTIWTLTGYGHLPRNAVQAGFNSKHDPCYIGRVNFKGNRIPAKYFPSKNRCYFVAGNQEGNWASCEVLLHRIDGHDWVSIDKSKDNPYPNNYVVMGQDQDGDDIAVGYINYKNEQNLVKIIPAKKTATIAYDGLEIPVDDSTVMMLVYHGRKDLRWHRVRETGDYPIRDAISIGATADGRIIHVGRYKRGNLFLPGKVIRREKTIHLAINGKEEIYTHSYEILVLPTSKDVQ